MLVDLAVAAFRVSLDLALTHPLSFSLSHALTPTFSLSRLLTPTFPLSLSHTHTLTLTLSHSPSLTRRYLAFCEKLVGWEIMERSAAPPLPDDATPRGYRFRDRLMW